MHLPNGSKVMVANDMILMDKNCRLVSRGLISQFYTTQVHRLGTGDYFVLRNSTAPELEGYVWRRVRYVNATAFWARGVDTSNPVVFPTDSTSELWLIRDWIELPCVMDVGVSTGAQQYYDVQCMTDKRPKRIRTYKDSTSVAYRMAHDPNHPTYPILLDAEKKDINTPFMMSIPRAQELRTFMAKVEFDENPTTTINEMETVLVDAIMHDDYQFMTVEESGIIPLSSFGYNQIGGHVSMTGDVPAWNIAKNMTVKIEAINFLPVAADMKLVDWSITAQGAARATLTQINGTTAEISGIPTISSQGYMFIKGVARDGGGATSGAIPITIVNAIAVLSYEVWAGTNSVGGKYYVDVNDTMSINIAQTPVSVTNGNRIWSTVPAGRGTVASVGGVITFTPSGVIGPFKVKVVAADRFGAENENLELQVVKKTTGAVFSSPPNDANFIRGSAGNLVLNVSKANADSTFNEFRYRVVDNINIISSTGTSVTLYVPTIGKGTINVESKDGYYNVDKNFYRSNLAEVRVTAMPGFPNVVSGFNPIENTLYVQSVSGGPESVDMLVNLPVCNIERFFFLQGNGAPAGGVSVTFAANANTHFSISKVINNITNPAQLNKPLMFFKHPSSGKWDMALMTV